VSHAELVGYLACALVFATFCTTAMPALRLVAIASNVAFIVYGQLEGLMPIVLLHAGLLPLNVWRLHQVLRRQDRAGGAPQAARPSMRFLRHRRLPRRAWRRPGHSRAAAPCWLAADAPVVTRI
jgi:hypothetical protein